MKLISMWEPWATLFVHGIKRIETRDWLTAYAGWVAVHATKGGLSKSDLRETCLREPFVSALRGIVEPDPKTGYKFAHGSIIGAVKLEACHPTTRRSWMPGVFEALPELETPQERAFGNYDEGRYGIVAAEGTFILPRPIPFTSRQGKLLDMPADIVEELRRQFKEKAAAVALAGFPS